jgi:hypothetical protein
VAEEQGCTWLGALYCPRCGHCTCPREHHQEPPHARAALVWYTPHRGARRLQIVTAPGCPLHGENAKHGDDPGQAALFDPPADPPAPPVPRPPDEHCDRARPGWRCTLALGHSGVCIDHPVDVVTREAPLGVQVTGPAEIVDAAIRGLRALEVGRRVGALRAELEAQLEEPEEDDGELSDLDAEDWQDDLVDLDPTVVQDLLARLEDLQTRTARGQGTWNTPGYTRDDDWQRLLARRDELRRTLGELGLVDAWAVEPGPEVADAPPEGDPGLAVVQELQVSPLLRMSPATRLDLGFDTTESVELACGCVDQGPRGIVPCAAHRTEAITGEREAYDRAHRDRVPWRGPTEDEAAVLLSDRARRAVELLGLEARAWRSEVTVHGGPGTESWWSVGWFERNGAARVVLEADGRWSVFEGGARDTFEDAILAYAMNNQSTIVRQLVHVAGPQVAQRTRQIAEVWREQEGLGVDMLDQGAELLGKFADLLEWL